MAAIYDAHNLSTITVGLQGSTVCDEAIIAARRIAQSRDAAVILDDDDGYWLVAPDSTRRAIGAEEADWIGLEPRP